MTARTAADDDPTPTDDAPIDVWELIQAITDDPTDAGSQLRAAP